MFLYRFLSTLYDILATELLLLDPSLGMKWNIQFQKMVAKDNRFLLS